MSIRTGERMIRRQDSRLRFLGVGHHIAPFQLVMPFDCAQVRSVDQNCALTPFRCADRDRSAHRHSCCQAAISPKGGATSAWVAALQLRPCRDAKQRGGGSGKRRSPAASARNGRLIEQDSIRRRCASTIARPSICQRRAMAATTTHHLPPARSGFSGSARRGRSAAPACMPIRPSDGRARR